ncbi:hypothetical protein KC19_7G055300 [Ceratodon purpureus]|uniref:Uncharacterized protein n=1 Tax=Ceratodon purpureus TaxID=3225 RepID=A0A8T0H507_CERPU|nr:hypothetical protein KC19_7G055300 [Ceratodon purpureus]
MRSHTSSSEAPRRGHEPVHERRQVNVDVNVVDAAAGWPLGRHGKHSTCSGEGAMASKAGNSVDHFKERHGATAQMSSRPTEEQSFDALAHEVEELIQRQPQFAFLKPCRQLEKHYTNRRDAGKCHAGDSSFRHGGSGSTVTEAQAPTQKEVCAASSAQGRDAHQRLDLRTQLGTAQLGPEQVGAKPRRESRRKLEDNSAAAQCWLRDSDAKPGSTTIRDLLSTDVEQGLRDPAPDHHVRVLNHHDATGMTSSSDPSLVSVSFKCEESERPQSISAAAQRALARKLSRDGIELNSFVEAKSESQGAKSARVKGKIAKEHQDISLQASPRRSVSERFSGRGHFHRNSGERIWRISSTRCSIHEKEAHIDLVAPAAAKFLVETSDSPLYTGAKHYNASPPAVAVPFKWEDAPGRAKLETATRKPNTLQLPPRLAVPLQRTGDSFSRDLRVSVVSHPLAGFFPCMTASSPSRPQQHDPTWLHHQRASKGMQPKQSHPHHGQETLPKSGDRCTNARKLNKSFSQPLASTGQSQNPKPRRLFSSELKSSHPWMQQGGHGGVPPPDPTSILHSSRQSSSSRTYLSCELDASTPRTAGSKSSSSVSYESIGEDFDHDESVSPNFFTNKPHSFDSQTTDAETPTFRSFAPPANGTSHGRRAHSHRSEGVKGLLKLCKSHGNCLGKSKSRAQRLGPLYSPEVWAPTLATYFQRLDVNNEPAISSSLLEKQGAPTSSGYLNSKGEPIPINNTQQTTTATESPEVSPDRPTRLPYKMPTVAEQERAARYPHRNSNSRAGRGHARSSMDLCPSPAYTAALEMLSPAVNLMASRRHRGARNSPWPGSPKPHRRVQFILSICKTLKRVLFRQQPRRSVIGTRLMYYDDRAPTTFQFSKPN